MEFFSGLASGLLKRSRLGGEAEVTNVRRFRRNEGDDGGEGNTKFEMRPPEEEEGEESG